MAFCFLLCVSIHVLLKNNNVDHKYYYRKILQLKLLQNPYHFPRTEIECPSILSRQRRNATAGNI